jgi:threonine dehydratase
MGQRTRDICVGVTTVKLLCPPNSNKRHFCRQTATVERKDRVISTLSDAATVTRDDVVAAGRRIASEIEQTPLIETDIGGTRVWLKCECLQTGGAFKLRGAANRLLQLSPEERERGVVAFSSGNHARGVAIAAKRLGIRAVIVMPADAPQVKVDGTRAEGAEIVFYDRLTEDREEITARIAATSGATIVPSFDDPAIVAGQGTAGLEIFEQLGRTPARVVIPCGGGGLASGIALAVPDAEIIVVEPHGWDDMAKSLEAGDIVPVGPGAPPTLCDAIMTLHVSPITLRILKNRGARAVSVSDPEVEEAIRFAWTKHHLVVEPGAAVGLAALLAGKIEPRDDTVVVVSGSNIDPALHARIVA